MPTCPSTGSTSTTSDPAPGPRAVPQRVGVDAHRGGAAHRAFTGPHFEVVAHDQRGLGRSAIPRRPVHDGGLRRRRARRSSTPSGGRPCRVVGVSFGGMVAQELAVTAARARRAPGLVVHVAGGAGGSSYPLHELAAMDPGPAGRDSAPAPRLALHRRRGWPTHPADRALVDAHGRRASVGGRATDEPAAGEASSSRPPPSRRLGPPGAHHVPDLRGGGPLRRHRPPGQQRGDREPQFRVRRCTSTRAATPSSCRTGGPARGGRVPRRAGDRLTGPGGSAAPAAPGCRGQPRAVTICRSSTRGERRAATRNDDGGVGVGPGLGREIVAVAIREGASVMMGARREENLRGRRPTASTRRGSGWRGSAPTSPYPADCDAALVDAAVERFGRLDSLGELRRARHDHGWARGHGPRAPGRRTFDDQRARHAADVPGRRPAAQGARRLDRVHRLADHVLAPAHADGVRRRRRARSQRGDPPSRHRARPVARSGSTPSSRPGCGDHRSRGTSTGCPAPRASRPKTSSPGSPRTCRSARSPPTATSPRWSPSSPPTGRGW